MASRWQRAVSNWFYQFAVPQPALELLPPRHNPPKHSRIIFVTSHHVQNMFSMGLPPLAVVKLIQIAVLRSRIEFWISGHVKACLGSIESVANTTKKVSRPILQELSQANYQDLLSLSRVPIKYRIKSSGCVKSLSIP